MVTDEQVKRLKKLIGNQKTLALAALCNSYGYDGGQDMDSPAVLYAAQRLIFLG